MCTGEGRGRECVDSCAQVRGVWSGGIRTEGLLCICITLSCGVPSSPPLCQVEIDDYQNYTKAQDVEDKMSFLQDRIQLVDRFATARR